MSDYDYPLPGLDDDSVPFWEAAKKHELHIQQCADCAEFRHPPQKICPACQSESSHYVRVSGRGRIFGWEEIYQPVLPAWLEDAPYNVVEVELDDAPGVVLTGNVPDAGEDELTMGVPVEVVFDDVTDDITIPRWRRV